MFGYIRAEKSELKVKEYETYKAVYCSLCREMGKKYGRLTRLTLSYDFTFLALLSAGMSSDPVYAERKACVCNPFKKCCYCCSGSNYAMPAAAAVILLYYKADDNVRDETGFRRILAWATRLIFSRAHRKAAADYPEIEDMCAGFMEAQKRLEEEQCALVDAAADPTAKFIGDLFSLCSNSQPQQRVLNRLGYCLGRWLYLLDALDDFETDRKRGSYNPFVIENQGDYFKTEQLEDRVAASLMVCESEAQAAFELLELYQFKTIVANILYLGLEQSRKKVRSKTINEKSI